MLMGLSTSCSNAPIKKMNNAPPMGVLSTDPDPKKGENIKK